MNSRTIKHVIHWFSPLPPARTDIAEYTCRILPALSRQAKVILWTDQRDWTLELETYAEVRAFDPNTFSLKCVAAARRDLNIPAHLTDSIFINIGNNWLFHAGLLTVAQKIPSVIILHDLVLQEMLLDSVKQGTVDGADYLDAIEEFYGTAARLLAKDALTGQTEARASMLAFPGLELVTRNALAIISHSPTIHQLFHHEPQVEPLVINLPFPSHVNVTARRLKSGPVRLVQFGHIGPNRRAIEILDTIGSLRDRIEFRLDVVGQIWNEDLLRRKIEACGLKGVVHLHGYLPENKLDELISQAHLVLNLRYPTMGEASGSQLRIWSRASCSVVSDHGWYATLPSNTVLKIPVEPGAEKDSLRDLLVDIDHNRAKFKSVGEAGLEWLSSKHDPEGYASEIYRVCERTSFMGRDMLIRRQRQRFEQVSGDKPLR